MNKLPENWGKGSIPEGWGKSGSTPPAVHEENSNRHEQIAAAETKKSETEEAYKPAGQGNEPEKEPVIAEKTENNLVSEHPDLVQPLDEAAGTVQDKEESADKKAVLLKRPKFNTVKKHREKQQQEPLQIPVEKSEKTKETREKSKKPKRSKPVAAEVQKEKKPVNKKILIAVIAAVLAIAAAVACILIFSGNQEEKEPENNVSSEVSSDVSEITSVSSSVSSEVESIAESAGSSASSESTESTVESSVSSSLESSTVTSEPVLNSTYTSEKYGFTVTLPEAWRKYGKIVDLEYDDGIGFCHKSGYSEQWSDSAEVFAIRRLSETDYEQYSRETIPLISKEGYVYYCTNAFGDTFDYTDPKITEEYSKLRESQVALLHSLVWSDIPEQNLPLSESEAKAVLQELIPAGQEIDSICSGVISYSESDSIYYNNTLYYAVTDPDYQSGVDILTALETVYTKEYAVQEIKNLDAYKTYITYNGKLYVVEGGGFGNGTNWYIDDLLVTPSKNPDIATIVLATNSGYGLELSSIELRKQNGKWLLNSFVGW